MRDVGPDPVHVEQLHHVVPNRPDEPHEPVVAVVAGDGEPADVVVEGKVLKVHLAGEDDLHLQAVAHVHVALAVLHNRETGTEIASKKSCNSI